MVLFVEVQLSPGLLLLSMMYGLLSLVTRWLCFGWIRTGSHLAVSLFFTGTDLRGVLSQPVLTSINEQFGRFGFDGIKTCMKCSPPKHGVIASKTGPLRTLPFKAHANCDLRSLRRSV